MIAAGLNDLGGAIQELDSDGKDTSKPKPPTLPRENHNRPANARAKRMDSRHLSTSSASSPARVSSDSGSQVGEGETTAVTTAPSLSRASSLNCQVHKRNSRAFTTEVELMTPASALTSSPRPPPSLDVSTSFLLMPSPTLLPSPLSNTSPAPKSPVSAAAMSSWMDSMGKKLSGLQKAPTYVFDSLIRV